MDTKLLNIFLDVARHGGFAAVARHMNQDPSSISRAIAALEHELGVRLFQRTTRQMSLTEAGSRFAAKVEPIMAELAQARDDIRTDRAQPRGSLKISASAAFGHECLMPLIPEFLARYPEVALDLDFSDRNVDLVAESVDLAIRLGPSVSADVVATRLRDTRYRVVASPDYLDAHGPIDRPGDLQDHRCACFNLAGFNSSWLFRRAPSPPQEVAIRPRLTCSSALGVRQAARQGLGPALLAGWLIAEDVRAGRLIELLGDYDVTATSFDTGAWILYPSRSFLPRTTRVMIDFLKEKLGSRAA